MVENRSFLLSMNSLKFLIGSCLVYVSVYFLTLGSAPLIGDDVPQALVNQSPPLLISERSVKIEGSYDLKSCKSCFYDENRENNSGSYKLAPMQPIFSVNIYEDKYPILKSRRMGGIPYSLFKLLIKVSSLEMAKNIFNLSVGILSLFFMFFSLKKKFNNRVAALSVCLASISPIFILNYSYYISEQLIGLTFWILSFYIQKQNFRSKLIIVFVFMVALHSKLNVLMTLIPLYILHRKIFHRNQKFCLLVGGLSVTYVVALLFLGDGVNEIVTRGGEGYSKPVMHIFLWLQEFMALFSHPIVFLNEQLNIYKLSETYTNNISISTLKYSGLFLLVLPVYLYWVIKNEDVRSVFIASFFWALGSFFVGHADITYTARFSEVNVLTVVLTALVLLKLFEQRGRVSWTLLTLMAILKLYFIISLIFLYQSEKVNNGSLSIKFNTKVSNFLLENKILNPILSYDETQWGIFELISEGQISPVYAQNLDENFSLDRIIKAFNFGYILVSHEEQIVLDPDGRESSRKLSSKMMMNILNSNGVTFNIVKEFKSNGHLIYTLVKYERKTFLPKLDPLEDEELLNIPYRKFYR